MQEIWHVPVLQTINILFLKITKIFVRVVFHENKNTVIGHNLFLPVYLDCSMFFTFAQIFFTFTENTSVNFLTQKEVYFRETKKVSFFSIR